MFRISAMGESWALWGATRSDRAKLQEPAAPAIASRVLLKPGSRRTVCEAWGVVVVLPPRPTAGSCSGLIPIAAGLSSCLGVRSVRAAG